MSRRCSSHVVRVPSSLEFRSKRCSPFCSLSSLFCRSPIFTVVELTMGRLSRYAQERILVLRSEQAKVGEILEKLSEEGISTTRQTVSRFLRVSSEGTKTRLNTNNSTAGEKQTGRKTKLKKEQLEFINKEIEKDDKLNARGIFLN